MPDRRLSELHDRKAKAASLATKAVETKGKGGVFSHEGQWKHKAKTASLATKAVETQGKGGVFDHEGGGNTIGKGGVFSHTRRRRRLDLALPERLAEEQRDRRGLSSRPHSRGPSISLQPQ